MILTIRNVQYHPNGDSVAVLCENPLSSFFVNLDQTSLTAAAHGGNWGDAEVLAEVTAAVAVSHPEIAFTVQLAPA